MLDKSIEFKNVIMRIEPDKIEKIEEPRLPDGFKFRFFTTGDEKHWSGIEASVLEFSSVREAELYFAKSYLPLVGELSKRCIFIINSEGFPVATTTAWFAESALGHQACLHWVAVRPEYQGLGLGKAVAQKALLVLRSLEPKEAVWLHTQTWSYVAIQMYHGMGFNIMKTDKLANMNTRNGIVKIYQNDYSEAIDVLKKVLDLNVLGKIIALAR